MGQFTLSETFKPIRKTFLTQRVDYKLLLETKLVAMKFKRHRSALLFIEPLHSEN